MQKVNLRSHGERERERERERGGEETHIIPMNKKKLNQVFLYLLVGDAYQYFSVLEYNYADMINQNLTIIIMLLSNRIEP